MKRPIHAVVLVVCLMALPDARAAQRAAVLDPSASQVAFTLDTTFHEVHGTMALTGGTIRFDPDTGEASGEITVDARKAETGNEGRDRKMHAVVLETALYPTIVFHPRRVEGTLIDPGRSELRLTGGMILHGAEHPMTVIAVVTSGNGALDGEVRFPIPYVEWGLKDPSILVARAAKTVEITVRAHGRWDDGSGAR